MSAWTLSLTDLANQAEAFLDQVDKKTAESLQEEDSPSYHEEEDKNVFSSLNNSLLPGEQNIFLTGSEESHSSPEIVPSSQDLVSLSDDSEDGEAVRGEYFDRLELENKLIKQEVTQLTDEIGFLSSKISSYRDKLQSQQILEEKQKKKLKEREEEITKQLSLIRSIKGTEADLKEALTAKDTQIGVLKVRLAEADSELGAQTAHTKRVEEELRVSSSCHGELSQLKEEVTVSNELVEHYKESLSKIQGESREREEELQCQIVKVTNTLHNTQQFLREEKRRYTSTLSELKLSQNELEFSRKDLSDYKERATRVLQAKEKKSPADTSILDDEGVEMMIQERNLIESELRSTKCELVITKEHLTSVEQTHSEELQQALEQCSTAESATKDRENELTEYQDIVSRLKEVTRTTVLYLV
ncbi:golgin subfamily A member 5-like [Bolinopsis microptera]|uniref:golgin subfamily A member 5-like n=1 Tax=Bolinopsis microptera TaxID=2820187 RepID=UPI003079FBF6